MKKRLVCTALLLVMALMVTGVASGLLTRTQLDAYTGVTVVLDGEVLDYTYDNGTKPDAFLVDGVTYLPVRAISEALGLDVEWDGDTATVTLSSGEAAPAPAGPAPAAAEDAVYVLMNIPYAEFYAAEGAVDAISSATLNGKAENKNVNGASYHESVDAGIVGATYPVKATAADLEALKALGAVEVTDADNIHYELVARGNTEPVDLTGALALQKSPTYSYYVLSEAPASYKELTVAGGKVSFGAVVGQAASAQASGTVTYNGRHTYIEIPMEGIEVEASDVSAVIVTMDNGTAYAMHHVVNIWRGTELGWNLSDLDLGGQTITGVRYMLKNGEITDYAVNIPILPNYAGEFTGALAPNGDIQLSGALADLAEAQITVKCKVGTDRGAPEDTVYAGPAAGTISLDQAKIADLIAQGEEGAAVSYTVTITSDNYADIVVTVG